MWTPRHTGPERLAGRLKARLQYADVENIKLGEAGALLTTVLDECAAHPHGDLRHLRRLFPRDAVAGLMLLEVRHVTQYHYAANVRESVMELWMQPQKGARQRLVSFELELDPPAQLFSYADAFGNAVYHFDVPQPHDRLNILARSAVETQPAAPCPTPWTWASGTG
jgi:hypothetical protein